MTITAPTFKSLVIGKKPFLIKNSGEGCSLWLQEEAMFHSPLFRLWLKSTLLAASIGLLAFVLFVASLYLHKTLPITVDLSTDTPARHAIPKMDRLPTHYEYSH